MTDPDPHDDTSADYEQFETELLTQDCDAAAVATGDIDNSTAHTLVSELVDADIVTPVPEDQVLVHEPSSTTFDSTKNTTMYRQATREFPKDEREVIGDIVA